MYFDGVLASRSLWLRLPMPKNSPDHRCPCRVHVWLRWQKWSGNVLTPSDVLVKGGRNSASMQSNDIGGGVEVHNNGLCWVGWSESPKQVLSDGHVVERCGVLDEFILILIWSSKEIKEINFCSTRTRSTLSYFSTVYCWSHHPPICVILKVFGTWTTTKYRHRSKNCRRWRPKCDQQLLFFTALKLLKNNTFYGRLRCHKRVCETILMNSHELPREVILKSR